MGDDGELKDVGERKNRRGRRKTPKASGTELTNVNDAENGAEVGCG